MTQQIINTGVADKGNGDPIRTAFTKVNANFTELFNHVSAGVVVGTTPPETPGEGDLWWDPESGRMYVYYNESWVDASPVDGAGISSTNQLVNGSKTVSLASTGIITLPSSSYLESTDTNLKVGAQGTVTIRSNAASNLTTKSWTFGTDGKLTTPGNLEIYDEDGFNAISTTGGLYIINTGLDQLAIMWNAGGNELPDGQDVRSANIFASSSGLSIEVINDADDSSSWSFDGDGSLQIPGDIKSVGNINIDIKLGDSPLRRWTFSDDGDLTLPAGGDILDSNGDSVLGGGSSGVVIPTATTSVFALGTDFTQTIVGDFGNGSGYIRVESNTGAPNFSPAPISTEFYNFLSTITAGTEFTVNTVVDGTTYNTVVSFTNFAAPGTVDTNRNDLYYTVVSGDTLPFSYAATTLTLTFEESAFSFTNTDVTFPDGTVQNTAWLGSVTGITSSNSTTYAVANNDWAWGDWNGIPSREFNGSSNSTIFFAALNTVQPGDTVVIGGAYGTQTYTIDSVSTDPYNTGNNPVSGYFQIKITADQAVGSVNTFTFDIDNVELAGNTTIENNLIINHNIRLKAGADIKNSAGASVLVSREPPFEIKTAGFVAVAGRRYGINTTDGAITVYLPTTPVAGDAIFFVDSHGTFSTNNLTIDGNEGWPYAKTIMGQATQTQLTDNSSFGLFYNGTEWRYYV